jgi:hypothetical protein
MVNVKSGEKPVHGATEYIVQTVEVFRSLALESPAILPG